jgi:hypothetical protein
MLIATVASSVPIHLAVPVSVHRGACLVLHLGDVAPISLLVEELLTGKEPVHQEVQGAVQLVQEANLSLTVIPVVPYERANDGVVFLPHGHCRPCDRDGNG